MQRTQREIEQKKLSEKNIDGKETDEASVDETNPKNTKRRLIKRRCNKIQPVEWSQMPQGHSEQEPKLPGIEQTNYGYIWLRKFRPSLSPIIEESPTVNDAEPSDQEEKPNEDEGIVKAVKLPKIPVRKLKNTKGRKEGQRECNDNKLPTIPVIRPKTSKVQRSLAPEKRHADNSEEKLPVLIDVKPGNETQPTTSKVKRFPLKIQREKFDEKLPQITTVTDTKKPGKETLSMQKFDVKLPPLSIISKPVKETQPKTSKLQKLLAKEQKEKSNVKLPLLTIKERPAKETKLEIQDYPKISSKNHWNRSNENSLPSLTAKNTKESQPKSKLQELNANEVLNKYRSNEKLPQLTVKGRSNILSRPKTGNLQKFSSKNILDKNDEKFKLPSIKQNLLKRFNL